MDSARSSIDPDLLLAQSGWVQSLARRLAHDHELAEDVAQETFLTALERPPRLAGNEPSLRAWLAQVVRSVVSVGARTEERRRHRERVAARPEGCDPTAETVERASQMQRVMAAVMALDEPYRSTLLLAHVDGLTNSEIAARLDISPVAVRKRLSRGLQRLRSELDREFDGDRNAWIEALAPLTGSLSWPQASLGATPGIGLVSIGLKLAAAALAAGTFALWWIEEVELLGDATGVAVVEAVLADPPNERRIVDAESPRSEAPASAQRVDTAWLGVRVIERGTGAPLADVPVLVRDASAPDADPIRVAATDVGGRARLELPANRAFQVTALGQERRSESREELVAPLAPGARRGLVFALATDFERTLVGTVVDRRSGEPISGVALRAAAPANDEVHDTQRLAATPATHLDATHFDRGPVLARSDEHGRFRVHVPDRSFELATQVPGFGLTLVRVDALPESAFELGEAGEAGEAGAAEGLARARIELDRVAGLGGVVLDAEGAPAADVVARVWALRAALTRPAAEGARSLARVSRGADADRGPAVSWTASGSEFELLELPSGVALAAEVVAAGGARWRVDLGVLAPGERLSRSWTLDPIARRSEEGAGSAPGSPRWGARRSGPNGEPAAAATAAAEPEFELPPGTVAPTGGAPSGADTEPAAGIALAAAQAWVPRDSGPGTSFDSASEEEHSALAPDSVPLGAAAQPPISLGEVVSGMLTEAELATALSFASLSLQGSAELWVHVLDERTRLAVPLSAVVLYGPGRRSTAPLVAATLTGTRVLGFVGLPPGLYAVAAFTEDGRSARATGLRLRGDRVELALSLAHEEAASVRLEHGAPALSGDAVSGAVR